MAFRIASIASNINCLFHCFQTHLPICSECLGTDKNAEGLKEALSECAGCGACVHLSCVSLPGSTTTNQFIALLSQPGAAWFCEECRTCSKCGKTYPTSTALQAHTIKVHYSGRGKDSGFYSCDCPHCPVTYKKPNLLRRHLCHAHPKEHLQKRNHVHCFVCFYTFPSSGELESHMKSHSHLQCVYCHKYLNTRHHLTLHVHRNHKNQA